MTRAVVNFGRNVRFTPRHLHEPASEAEVLAILDRHAAGKVRVVGSLHSWNPAVVSADALIDLRHLNRVELARGRDGDVRATVGGGCRIKRLLHTLYLRARVTLPSIGLITEQTIAGAVSTATHGSGRHSLSHYVEEVRVAAFDPETGRARAYTWSDGVELRAARCALGCAGVVLSVRFRCIPAFDVAERMELCDSLDAVLAGEERFPLQQFYMAPHARAFFVQRRVPLPDHRPRPGLPVALYRAWWFLGLDVGLHLILKFLAAFPGRPGWTRFFYRRLLKRLVLRGVTVTDRSDRILVMEHELFRHLEIELFVPAARVREAAEFVRGVLEVVAGDEPTPELAARLDAVGMREELHRLRGTFTHHYPITFRRVLPDDTLISTTAGDEVRYAVSFITLAEPRDAFLAMGSFLARSMAKLFDARPHWGKWFPLGGDDVERLYPGLPEFREVCRVVDPRGVFRNEFTDRVLFGG